MTARPLLLVGFTPAHLIPMLEIARGLDRQAWVFHPEAHRIPKSMRDGLDFLGGCEEPRRPRALKYASAGLSLRRILRKGADAVACVPHPFNPLSNFAFFAPGTAEVRIYQDGVLNYYDAANPLDDPAVLFRRRAKAAIALLPYRVYAGHLSGVEARRVTTGYFTHPELVVRQQAFERMVRLEFNALLSPQAPAGEEPFVLFLDQPIDRLMPANVAARIRQWAYSYADSLGAPVAYKPHYTQRMARVPRPGWQMVSAEESSLPAEEIPAARRLGAVVSFCSSALANIRLATPTLRCVAIGASMLPIRVDGHARTMADLLGSLGVETLEPTPLS